MELDAPLKEYDSFDGHQTYRLLLDWPRLARLGLGMKPEVPRQDPDELVFLGLGSSASVGDIVSDWLNGDAVVSTRVFRGCLPKFDSVNSLVIACSVSGNTPETIETTRAAHRRGAKVIAIASGGGLESLSADLGIPFVKLPVNLTGRFGFPCLFFATLAVVRKAFPRLELGTELEQSIESLKLTAKRIGPQVPTKENVSKQVASAIEGRIPVVYGSSATRGVAIRFKNQLNENAKLHAMAEFAPDSFHNEVESWQEGAREFVPILLRHDAEMKRERKLLDFYRKILTEREFYPVEVSGAGKGHLEELASLTYVLDFASYFTAVLLDHDPYPIGLIEKMKTM